MKQRITSKQSQCTLNANTLHNLQQLTKTRPTICTNTHSVKILHFTLMIILYGQQLHDVPIVWSNRTRHIIATYNTNAEKMTNKSATKW